MLTGSPVVDAIGQMHFEGNIIPHSWRQCDALRFDNGKLNSVAIDVLADIIYWYRPSYQRDEHTGHVTGIKRKFAGEKLQRDYQAWADYLGRTKREIQDAVAFLVKRKLIIREFHATYRLPSGLVLYNVIFVEPIPDAIRAITYEIDFNHTSRQNVRPVTAERETSPDETLNASRQNGTGDTPEREPYTKTLPHNKGKNKLSATKANQSLAQRIYEQLPPGELRGLKYQPGEPQFAEWIITHYHREARQLRESAKGMKR